MRFATGSDREAKLDGRGTREPSPHQSALQDRGDGKSRDGVETPVGAGERQRGRLERHRRDREAPAGGKPPQGGELTGLAHQRGQRAGPARRGEHQNAEQAQRNAARGDRRHGLAEQQPGHERPLHGFGLV